MPLSMIFLDTKINGLISKNYFLYAAKEYKNNRTKNSIELTGNAYNVSICNNMVVIENIWMMPLMLLKFRLINI